MDRRTLLKTTSAGFGYLAFAGLSQLQAAEANKNPLAPKATHFPGTAKRVIFLFMNGAPSHVDTFDYKPKLTRDDGKTAPGRGGFGGRKLLGSPYKFAQSGQSGLWISEIFPEVAKMADDLCLLRGMHTDSQAHPQATLQAHTGSFTQTRPSMGAWTLYGMGTENQNLPGFVSIRPSGGPINYGSAFLPAMYQGTRVSGGGGFGGGFGGRGSGEVIGNISNRRLSTDKQRAQIDFMQELNQDNARQQGGSDDIEGVISSFELAFRMQAELPKVMDLSKETAATLARYGANGGGGGGGFGGGGGTSDFGRQCLVARRLIEAGVRFVELSHGNWDQHNNLKADHQRHATSIDKPIAALLADLKERGLLKDTLVIWGGEFGRTPSAQGTDGRDHNNKGYTMWLAGGGIKGGFSYGNTDDHGFEAVEGKMHVHDLHATVLHLLGFDHEKLTYRHGGRDYRLTDVYGKVPKEILA